METKIDGITVKGINNTEVLQCFAPQVILPEKTLDFFLLNRNHLLGAKDLKLLVAFSVGGEVEKISTVQTFIDDLTSRSSYSGREILGFFIQRIYPHIQGVLQEVTEITGNKDEVNIRMQQTFAAKLQKPEVMIELLSGMPLPFMQLIQSSLAGFLSKEILNSTNKICEGLGLKKNKNGYNKLDGMLFDLYNSNILFPVFSTSICTNQYKPHFDFILSNMPMRKGNCRICGQPLIVFNLYLVGEPYSSIKIAQKDVSYAIAAYLSNKSTRELECFPEVILKNEKGEEQADVYIRNWITQKKAIVECKTKEFPSATYETKLNIIYQDVLQLVRKVRMSEADFGYVVSNIIFESEDEKKRVLEESLKKLEEQPIQKIELLAKINNKEMLNELDKIISDMKQPERALPS